MDTIAAKRLKKRPLYSQEIRETIQNAILKGRLKPGDRVVETRLAKELGVSQSPVREAIRELEMIGLIEIRPFQGAYVRSFAPQDMKESYKVRSALEAVALEALVSQITDEQIEDLSETIQGMEEAGKANDLDLFTRLDTLFHQKIVDWSGNQLLARLWEQCKITEFTRTSALLSTMSLVTLGERHRRMLEALKKKDEKAAIVAACEHFDVLSEELDSIDPDIFS